MHLHTQTVIGEIRGNENTHSNIFSEFIFARGNNMGPLTSQKSILVRFELFPTFKVPALEVELLSLQSDCIRKPSEAQTSCTSYAPASSNLISFFFWSHGFHGNSPIVLTGSGECCISGIIFHYKTHTHTHTQVGVCDAI